MGLKLEVANKEETIHGDSGKVLLRLRVIDAKKRKDKHRENEAIEFEFDINKDNPDKCAEGMLKSQMIMEEDERSVAKMIRAQVSNLNREREDRRKRQKEEEVQQQKQQEEQQRKQLQ